MEWLMLLAFGPMALALLLQLLALLLTRTRLKILRWAALAPLPVPVGMAAAVWLDGGWFWELGVALFLGIAAFYLLGWSLAWGLFALWEKRRAGGGGRSTPR